MRRQAHIYGGNAPVHMAELMLQVDADEKNTAGFWMCSAGMVEI
jgi:hypothetical protein